MIEKKVKCEIDQGLVMINLYVKFNVNSRSDKQVIALAKILVEA